MRLRIQAISITTLNSFVSRINAALGVGLDLGVVVIGNSSLHMDVETAWPGERVREHYEQLFEDDDEVYVQALEDKLTIYTADSVFVIEDQTDFVSYEEVSAVLDDYYSESEPDSWESVDCIVSRDDFYPRHFPEPVQCSVCLGDFKSTLVTSCGHPFCEPCVENMVKFQITACPMCRNPLPKPEDQDSGCE